MFPQFAPRASPPSPRPTSSRPLRPIGPLRHSVPFLHSVKKFSATPCIFKTRAILLPLEVYLVNSPSWPNVCPPAPVECGGMTPLGHRETCLPVDRTPLPPSGPAARPGWGRLVPTILAIGHQIKPNQTTTPFRVVRVFRGSTSPTANQGKNPSNQGSSCLIKANDEKMKALWERERVSDFETDGVDLGIYYLREPANWLEPCRPPGTGGPLRFEPNRAPAWREFHRSRLSFPAGWFIVAQCR